MNYKDEARQLVKRLDQRMGPSPYDIAWLARLQRANSEEARWPDLLDWLLENQRPDGSWGGQIRYYHDRIICTLSAIIALRENGKSEEAQIAIRRGERFLWHHLHLLHSDPFELVGFELIFPTLLAEAQSLGLNVPTHTCGYAEIQAQKIRLIPPDLLYSPHISTVHSLEFLGRTADRQQIQQALASNGSLGNSPATTAAFLMLCPQNKQALSYLQTMRSLDQIIYLYPFRTFELTWVLNNLSFSGVPVTDFAGPSIWKKLQAEMDTTGIGLDPTFGISDGDITSVTTRLLLSAGYAVDPAILRRFEDKKSHIFRTYDYERNASVGTNVHALEVLDLLLDYPRREKVKEQIILLLLEQSIFNIFWIDKWHVSPYYATAHILARLIKEGDYLAYACQGTIEWLIHTQNDDGSWGFFQQGTAEETAYALTALLHYHQYAPIDPDILHRGAAYLAWMHEEGNMAYPELWIGKCLYIPYDVVRAAILAALIKYEEIFGTLP